MIQLEGKKGGSLPLLELAVQLRHKRKTSRIVPDAGAAKDGVCRPRWPIVLQKRLFSSYNVVQVLTVLHVERTPGASYRGTVT